MMLCIKLAVTLLRVMKTALLLALLLPLAACTSLESEESESFLSLERGTQSGISEPGAHIARDAVALRALWAEHGRSMMPSPTPPSVDFGKYLLVFVSAGSRPTAGYSLRVERVHVEQGTLFIEARESSPGKGTLQAQVLTSPYEVVLLPRTAMPVQSRIRH